MPTKAQTKKTTKTKAPKTFYIVEETFGGFNTYQEKELNVLLEDSYKDMKVYKVQVTNIFKVKEPQFQTNTLVEVK